MVMRGSWEETVKRKLSYQEYEHCLCLQTITNDYLSVAPVITNADDYEEKVLAIAENLGNYDLYMDLMQEIEEYRACL